MNIQFGTTSISVPQENMLDLVQSYATATGLVVPKQLETDFVRKGDTHTFTTKHKDTDKFKEDERELDQPRVREELSLITMMAHSLNYMGIPFTFNTDLRKCLALELVDFLEKSAVEEL